MATYNRISDFVKSGPRRLRDAEKLMEPPTRAAQGSDEDQRHLRAAMYLAGHAVECLLKAFLIDQEGCQSLAEAQNRINRRRLSQGQEAIPDIAHTSAGHNIGLLIGLTDLAVRPGRRFTASNNRVTPIKKQTRPPRSFGTEVAWSISPQGTRLYLQWKKLRNFPCFPDPSG